MLRPHLIDIRDAIRMVNEKKDPTTHLRKILLNSQDALTEVMKEEF